MSDKFTHINEAGDVHMVDVGGKSVTEREAIAVSSVIMQTTTLEAIEANDLHKGDVFATARIGGIMAAKRTSELIPMCHPIALTHAEVTLVPVNGEEVSVVEITAIVRTTGKTGVEMEALTACSVAALTIYDMCKSVDRAMVLGETLLMHKSGGRSGNFTHPKFREIDD